MAATKNRPWTNSRDGVVRTDVRVDYRLSRDDLARILCAAFEAEFEYDSAGRVVVRAGDRQRTSLSIAYLWECIRKELRHRGTSRADFWQDAYAEHSTGEPTADDAWKWAQAQVTRL